MLRSCAPSRTYAASSVDGGRRMLHPRDPSRTDAASCVPTVAQEDATTTAPAARTTVAGVIVHRSCGLREIAFMTIPTTR